MPPVRDPSTKPSAATVLPAPVACSNQKRLAALGSSGWSGSWSSSTSESSTASDSAQSIGSSSTSSSSSPSRSISSGAGPSSAPVPLVWVTPTLPLGPRPLLLWLSASSAVSVPDSASTWCALSTVPSFSTGSGTARMRSSPSSSDHLRRHATDGLVAPPSSSASASSSARRRASPGASTTAGSSPSSTKGSRVKARARSSCSEVGSGGTMAASAVSAMHGLGISE